MKKTIIVDTYDYNAFKNLLKKNKNPIVQPFYVALSSEEYNSLRLYEKKFLENNYKKENDYIYTNYVVFINEKDNSIKDYNSFLLVDEKTFKVINKLKIIDSKIFKEENTNLVMERYLVQENGKTKHYTLREILECLPLDKHIEITEKIERSV